MNKKFGAPWGAFFGVYGPQSAFESRTSSLMTPLNALSDLDACALAGVDTCCEHAVSASSADAAATTEDSFTMPAFPSHRRCTRVRRRGPRVTSRDLNAPATTQQCKFGM